MPLYSKIGYCPYEQKIFFPSLFCSQLSDVRACPNIRKLGAFIYEKCVPQYAKNGYPYKEFIMACPSVRVENISWKALNLPIFFVYEGMPLYSGQYGTVMNTPIQISPAHLATHEIPTRFQPWKLSIKSALSQ